jgi:hypothetical protein
VKFGLPSGVRGIGEAVLAGVCPLLGIAVERTTNGADAKIPTHHRRAIPSVY